ncbi:hypothetical protein FACS189485_18180 [Spirochaetia bacterium]|nr:hypothetical protein FACS189485_18180 [Spirochaetia bacterium]
MDLQKIKVRQDLARMVRNYVLAGKIDESQEYKITSFIDFAIGGGELSEETPTGKVFYFPGEWQEEEAPKQPEYKPPQKKEKEIRNYQVMPDEPFPEIGESDLRKVLQRDGLILQGWEHWIDFKYVEYGAWKSLGSAYRAHWIASSDKHFQYQSGIVLEGEIYEAIPINRGGSFCASFNHARRQGTGEYLSGAELPDSVVYTLLGRHTFEIRDYIEKYKEFGISKNLEARFTLKIQKEQANV